MKLAARLASIVFQTLRFISSNPLSSRHRVSALARYLRWQVESRVVIEVAGVDVSIPLRDAPVFEAVGGTF